MSKETTEVVDRPLDSIASLPVEALEGAENAFAHTLKQAEEAGGVQIGAVLLQTPKGVATCFFPNDITLRQIASFLISTAMALLAQHGTEPDWQK